ncbi:hypothetical protein D3C87_1595570 [compost metagenome]
MFGKSRRILLNSSRWMVRTVVSSTAIAVAERGWPSRSDISPKSSAGPTMPRMCSRPSPELTTILTLPSTTM